MDDVGHRRVGGRAWLTPREGAAGQPHRDLLTAAGRSGVGETWSTREWLLSSLEISSQFTYPLFLSLVLKCVL